MALYSVIDNKIYMMVLLLLLFLYLCPDSGKTLMIEILIPVVGVVTVLLLAVVVVAGIFCYYKKKKSQAYAFQRMTFNDVRDEE